MDLSNLTLGDIAQAFVFLSGLIGSILYLKAHIHEWVLGDTDKKLEAMEMEACKDYIVRVIGDLERDEKLSETEIQRFYDRYDPYVKKGYNGYIKAKVEELQSTGKLKTFID